MKQETNTESLKERIIWETINIEVCIIFFEDSQAEILTMFLLKILLSTLRTGNGN